MLAADPDEVLERFASKATEGEIVFAPSTWRHRTGSILATAAGRELVLKPFAPRGPAVSVLLKRTVEARVIVSGVSTAAGDDPSTIRIDCRPTSHVLGGPGDLRHSVWVPLPSGEGYRLLRRIEQPLTASTLVFEVAAGAWYGVRLSDARGRLESPYQTFQAPAAVVLETTRVFGVTLSFSPPPPRPGAVAWTYEERDRTNQSEPAR